MNDLILKLAEEFNKLSQQQALPGIQPGIPATKEEETEVPVAFLRPLKYQEPSQDLFFYPYAGSVDKLPQLNYVLPPPSSFPQIPKQTIKALEKKYPDKKQDILQYFRYYELIRGIYPKYWAIFNKAVVILKNIEIQNYKDLREFCIKNIIAYLKIRLARTLHNVANSVGRDNIFAVVGNIFNIEDKFAIYDVLARIKRLHRWMVEEIKFVESSNEKIEKAHKYIEDLVDKNLKEISKYYGWIDRDKIKDIITNMFLNHIKERGRGYFQELMEKPIKTTIQDIFTNIIYILNNTVQRDVTDILSFRIHQMMKEFITSIWDDMTDIVNNGRDAEEFEKKFKHIINEFRKRDIDLLLILKLEKLENQEAGKEISDIDNIRRSFRYMASSIAKAGLLNLDSNHISALSYTIPYRIDTLINKYKSKEEFFNSDLKLSSYISKYIIFNIISYDISYYETMLRQISSSKISDLYRTFISRTSPPFTPEMALKTVQILYKSGDIKSIKWIVGKTVNYINVDDLIDMIYNILEENGSLNTDAFIKMIRSDFIEKISYIMHYYIFYGLKNDKYYREYYKVIKNILSKNYKNLDSTVSKLRSFSINMHNVAGSLKPNLFNTLFNSPIINSKLDISDKILEICSKVIGAGGYSKFIKKFEKQINICLEQNLISSDFKNDLKTVVDLVMLGKKLHPGMENFHEIKSKIILVQTNMWTVTNLEAFNKYYEIAKDNKKNPNLFKLDFQINQNLRFRVLKDLDPTYFTIGVTTDCCQRLGGAAETAAIDSYVNPMAGVVVLEWLNNNEWVVLAQSYFHYVKTSAGRLGYILDNVETNPKTVEKSGLNLEHIYAYWAQKIKEKYNIDFFETGKGYSDIKTSEFDTSVWTHDDRTFSSDDVYSDWSESNSCNLLAPKFDQTKEDFSLNK